MSNKNDDTNEFYGMTQKEMQDQERSMVCPDCEGKGKVFLTCMACNGSGEGMADGTRCRSCGGGGREQVVCETCEGEGNIIEY